MTKTELKPEIIAEIGMTHDGSIGLARSITKKAISSGASIIKYQLHIADFETTKYAPSPPYFLDESRYEYFKRTEFTEDQWRSLVDFCHSEGVDSCVSVFSEESARLAKKIGFRKIKVPSGEVTNIPLLRLINKLELPVILSSGMSNWSELDLAVEQLRSVPELAVLQCTSLYPTPANKVGLNIIQEIRNRYGLTTGISDHTTGIATSIAAIALGGTIVEKHFTLSKDMYGPDAQYSLTPTEFRELVDAVEYVFSSLSSPVDKNEISDLVKMREIFQKSIFIARSCAVDHVIEEDDLMFMKPGTGILASRVDDVVGKKTNKYLPKGHPLSWDDLKDVKP